jgi:hypothetical protein
MPSGKRPVRTKSSRANVNGAGTRPAENVAELRARLTRLVDEANGGNRDSLAKLRRMLDEHPEIWKTIGNLASHAEQTWITLVANDDHLVAESLTRQVADMKETLAGPHPTGTEKLLIDQVVVCWLAMQHAEMCAAQSGGSVQQARFRVQRVDSAGRQYLGAIRILTLLRAKLPHGLVPLNKFKVFKGELG